MRIPPGGTIPTKVLQQTIQDKTVRAALRSVAARGGLYEVLSSGQPPPLPLSNGAYAADGTLTGYAVVDVDAVDGAAPVGP
jgi:hypothetical protein